MKEKLSKKEEQFDQMLKDTSSRVDQGKGFTVDELYNYKEQYHTTKTEIDQHYYLVFNNDIIVPNKSEQERLKKGYLRSYLDKLVKKGKLELRKEGKRNIYINPERNPNRYALNDVFCNIQEEVGKRYNYDPESPYPIKYARDVAKEKYNIDRQTFDKQLEIMIRDDYRKFDLGHGITSFLKSEDSFDMKVASNIPDSFFFISKRCKK